MAGSLDQDRSRDETFESGNASRSGAAAFDDVAETERLLSMRTRDIVLEGEMLARYRAQSWPQRSKITRSWTIWVTFLSLSVIGINRIIAPDLFWLSVAVCGLCVPLLNLAVHLIWSRPRSAAVEGLSIVLWTMGSMISYSVLGAEAGGVNYERYLTVTLFVATIGVMVLGIEMSWTKIMALGAASVFLVVELLNPIMTWPQAVAMTFFYGLGLYATTVARQTATILAQRSFLMARRDKHRSEALAAANKALEQLAAIDPLTGVANRRSAMTHIARIWADGELAIAGVVVVMADIDHFKKLNDTRGHAAGDICIRDVASAISGSIRTGIDIVSRHGGEEFLIVLAGAQPALAASIAERIRSAVEALAIPNPGVEGGIVTLSLGVAFAEPGAGPELVTKWADDALYEAKRLGRNRISTAAASSRRGERAAIDAPSLDMAPDALQIAATL